MEYLQTLWSHLISIQIRDILDIVIVAFLRSFPSSVPPTRHELPVWLW